MYHEFRIHKIHKLSILIKTLRFRVQKPLPCATRRPLSSSCPTPIRTVTKAFPHRSWLNDNRSQQKTDIRTTEIQGGSWTMISFTEEDINYFIKKKQENRNKYRRNNKKKIWIPKVKFRECLNSVIYYSTKNENVLTSVIHEWEPEQKFERHPSSCLTCRHHRVIT